MRALKAPVAGGDKGGLVIRINLTGDVRKNEEGRISVIGTCDKIGEDVREKDGKEQGRKRG